MLALAAVNLAAPLVIATDADATDHPGPSNKLFSKPYYACSTNFYVSPTGNDQSSGTTPTTAWKTLQHANNALPSGGKAAGACVNVAPGTYSGVELTNGGNLAAATGYVVYRCTALDACTVQGNAGIHGAEAFETLPNTNGTPPNYLMFDGFVLDGADSSANGVGISSWNGNNSAAVASHHVWVLNSIIEGFGQSGVGIAASEYYYVIHNKIMDNSHLQCNSQGSGVAINIMHTVPNYTPTPDDLKNPNPMLGPTWVVGNSFFHNVVEWNVIRNNGLTQCGTQNNPTDTDGNGIIFDTNLQSAGNSQDYLSPSLTAFNAVFNNGGSGIHVFLSADVTIANNTCFNNQTDPGNGGTSRACIDDSNGFGNTIINNIAVAAPAPSGGSCWPVSPPYAKYNLAIGGWPAKAPYDTFSRNITYLRSTSCNSEVLVNNGDSYSCQNNKCATDPLWTKVGTESIGTETTPPVGRDFGLLGDSPATGYGLQESYLPAQSVDVGACAHGHPGCW
ncbi:MAG TPA: hypothetical protein VMB71_06180 [Acetobacteraceae bacterium]|nr:hypothetical protein [Acetobacteraceae bacterium]